MIAKARRSSAVGARTHSHKVIAALKILSLASLSLLAACVSTASAQPRRAPRRPAVVRADAGSAAPAADASTPVDAGPRDARWVVQRGRGSWQPACVASAGCTAPQTIPRCPSGPNVRLIARRSFGDVADNRLSLAGQLVAVRGTLTASAGCTEVGCPDGACCNHCQGSMALEGSGTTSLRTIGLRGLTEEAFACRGDDSGICCGTEIPAGGAVVAAGTLRATPNSGGAYHLEGATLCVE